MDADALEDWFERYDVEDPQYIQRDGRNRSGYALFNYERKGYARYILEENVAGEAWNGKELRDGYHRYTHDEHEDVSVEISDNDFWIYLPELKETQEDELKAVLAGGPPKTLNPHRGGTFHAVSPAVVDLDYIIDWVYNDENILSNLSI